MVRVIHRLLGRRRERALARQLERRARERVDAGAAATAQMADQLRRE